MSPPFSETSDTSEPGAAGIDSMVVARSPSGAQQRNGITSFRYHPSTRVTSARTRMNESASANAA